MFPADQKARSATPTDAVRVARQIATLIVLVLAVAASGAFPRSARADGVPVYEAPAGSADSSSGTCTETASSVFSCSDLRAAISAADGNAGSTIKLEPGVYQLGEAHGLPSGALAYLRVDASLTIEGAGPEATTIEQTSGRDPIMLIPYDNTDTPWQISIEGVELTGGVGAGHEEGEEFGAEQGGGALRINAGKASGSSVTLFDDALVGNRAEAQTAHGGAIFNRGVLNMIDTTVAHNIARAEGANSSTEAGEAAGGGIFSTGSMLITDSTIADNTAEAGGAYSKAAGGGLDSGIENFSNGATLEVVDTTITGNVASAGTTTNPPIVEGGGIALNRGQLTHVTLDGNVASPVNAWVAWGGNLYGDVDWIASSIIADGTAAEGGNCLFEYSKPNPEFERTDLEDDAVSECGFLDEYSSIFGHSPQLMPLAANGGPTETMAPTPGSPVIDAGAECGWPRTVVDQRGMPRDGRCDIGAFQTELPFATAGPKVVGTAEVGQTLTCEPGLWTGEGTLAYAYEWLREGVAAGDQTPSYTVGAGDAGTKFACRITTTGTYGSTEATSVAVEALTPPTPPSPPATTNTPAVRTSNAPATGIARVASSATVMDGKAYVPVTCAGEGACTGSLTLVATVGQKQMIKSYRRKRLRHIVIGTGSFSIAEGESETVAVPLNAKGRSLFRTAGKRGLAVTVDGSDVKAARMVLEKARAPGHGAKESMPRPSNPPSERSPAPGGAYS